MDTWSDKIRSAIDDGDHFMVIDITGQRRQGWMPKKAWDWIRTNESSYFGGQSCPRKEKEVIGSAGSLQVRIGQ